MASPSWLGRALLPLSVLRAALCETAPLNLNSGEESLRSGEAEPGLAAIKTRLQGTQRPCKRPTQPKLRTRWRCWDAKSWCVGANLNGPSNFFTTTLASEKNQGFVSLVKAL